MNHKYIDSNTFEIRDDVFEVDEEMANAIVLLNKKGYKTLYSCSGHYDKNIHRVKYTNEELKTCDLSSLKDYDLINKGDYSIIYFKTVVSRTYINFDRDYNFATLPIGFSKNPKWDEEKNSYSTTEFIAIGKEINFYEGNRKKTREKVEKEIKENNKAIYEWVKSLPSICKK